MEIQSSESSPVIVDGLNHCGTHWITAIGQGGPE